MATSSITANFEIRDPKAYLPSEASFAKQSGYSSARAFVDGIWKAYRMKPPRPPSMQVTRLTSRDEIRAFFSQNGKLANA